MTETATAETQSDSNVTDILTGSEPKLWAGKYKTVEELEEGYKSSLTVHNENKELKKQLESFTNIPDDYSVPDDLALREIELKDIKALAKNAGLTQEQFLRTAKEMQNRIAAQNSQFENAKKEIGEETLNVLDDYVSKNYPSSLKEHILNKLIRDKKAMTEAMEHRDKTLNSSAPGMDRGSISSPEKYDGAHELQKAAAEHHKDPRNKEKKARYLNLAKEVGHERFGK